MNGEFKCEREIRDDEERIAHYYDNLPLFLDLPGENEAIFERIIKNAGEKVPHADSPESLRRLLPSWADDEDDEDISRADRAYFRPEEYEMLDMLDHISNSVAVCFALCDDEEDMKKYLAILCQCGKTLARISDLLYAFDDEQDMKTALCKRALRDINDLAVMFSKVSYALNPPTDIMQIIRSKVLNILFELQKN